MLDQTFVNDLARRLELEDPSDFIHAVIARLRKGEREYADNPSTARPIEEIIRELAEEAEDVGGWASRAWERLPHEGLNPADADHARRMIVDMVVDGFRIRAKADLLLEYLEESRAVAVKLPEPPVALCP